MTKKRIADLLKEEIEKSDQGTGADNPATPDQTSKAKARKPAAKAGTATTAKTSAARATSTASKAAAAKSTAAAKPDQALTQKNVALEAALQKNAEQVAALRADVDTHQSRIFELKDALQEAETASQKKDTEIKDLTAKLTEAKQTILKLTEASESAAQPEPAAQKEAQKESEASKRQSLQLKQRSPYSGYKSIPEYAIQRGTPAGGQNNSMMNDDDLGWVD